jgi:DNA-binding transcriptional regulator YhcF (GntR family)
VARWAEVTQQSEAVHHVIVRYNEVQLAQVQQSVACHALHDVEARLCRWLLEARHRVGSDTLPLTQEFLAEILGVRRTTVTLVAQMLQSAGFIHYRRGILHIRDAMALEDAACECHRVVRRLTDRFLTSASSIQVSAGQTAPLLRRDADPQAGTLERHAAVETNGEV